MPRFSSLLFVALLTPALASAQGRMDDLRWLVGCWERARGASKTIERWNAPAGGIMIGESRSYSGNTDRQTEALRLIARADTVIYEATPVGQTRTEFRTTSTRGDEITFANPEHDFPQRIIYRRSGPDSLIARIEGDRAGRQNPITFPFRKIDCGTVQESPTTQVQKLLQPRYDDMIARENVFGGAANGWIAEHAAPGFTHVTWATAAPFPPTTTADVLARASESARSNPAWTRLTNRKFNVTIDQILLRGDTAEAMIAMTRSWNFVDSAGSYGARGDTHSRSTETRRIDRWIRIGTDWKLREVAVVNDEASIDGKLILKNGKRP